jgi:hypothetical protein
MASEKQIAANRRNAQKSTGPRTDAGKARSRLNAVTHGLNAHVETLPDEEKAEFEQRVTAWSAALQPCTAYEEELVRRAVSLSWRLDRADRAQAALIADSVDEAAEAEIRQKREDFEDAARRLLPDLAPKDAPELPPAPRRKIGEYFYQIDDPDDPLVLVTRLERNTLGCRWMCDRWAELRAVIDTGKAWSDAELTRALRLLGHRPLDAADDDGVLRIIAANFAVDQSRPDPFSALWNGLDARECTAYRGRLVGRRLSRVRPESIEAARDFLLDTIDETTERLEALEAELIAREAGLAGARPLTHLFDDSAEGRWLRSRQRQYNHAIARIMERFRKARRRGQPMTADPPPRRRLARPKDPKPITAMKPKPYISPSDQWAAERWKRGIRWRKPVVPPWRSPGGRTVYKHYPGYPAPPQLVRRRRKMSKKRFYEGLQKFVVIFRWLGLIPVLIALLVLPEVVPGLGGGRSPFDTDSQRGIDERIFTTEHTDHTEKDPDEHDARKDTAEVDARIAASSFRVIRVFRGSISVATSERRSGNPGFDESHRPAWPSDSCSFRVPAGWTPAKTQNEANFGPVLRLVAAAEPASGRLRDRSRGPPMPQIAALTAARPPPEACLEVPP